MKAAVLIACHNRKEKTRNCLQNLFEQDLPKDSTLEVFLCDDGSTDGTSEMINSEFPQVHTVYGSGNLFWNGGMDLAWKNAIESDDFDFYFWLNDDTFLLPNAIKNIYADYLKVGKPNIITAACKIPNTEEFSYGGWDGFGPIKPKKNLQQVTLISGNFVMISREIVRKIGTLSPSYTHYLGDYDYGLRAIEAGFKCYTSSDYLAECDTNILPYWGNPSYPLRKRWKMLHDVKGQAFSEYLRFKFRHYGVAIGIKTMLDTYSKVLSPNTYTNFRDLVRKKVLRRTAY
ncbi:glycosyltransferase family 2 protein [Algoriphagus aquimarinus]|uniref:Glycosyltransferase, GT2 family n=1 Tax=Algoriphagus aquimarinus TaxID=237018 RepID=A0A1I1AUT8_9BACT|nr:glycosyltransferase family 2 protein [Algoriphagus aquimarinus]SFB41814.1 Glycosyltransferase, GT2 family [Algoriphagus aquimarinus]